MIKPLFALAVLSFSVQVIAQTADSSKANPITFNIGGGK
jgi:hypothetical protein